MSEVHERLTRKTIGNDNYSCLRYFGVHTAAAEEHEGCMLTNNGLILKYIENKPNVAY
jgi:hypothetical protein